MRTLIDALAVARTAVLGWSMGGQYALACAAHLHDRVTRTVVIAGTVLLDDGTTFAELNSMDRRFTRLAQHHPHLASTLFATLGEIARHTPDVWAHLTARGAVPGEAEAMRALPDPGIAAAAAAGLAHSEGMVEEYRAWVRPWGFAPEDVRGPVTIWQGDADELVPPRWAHELTRPNCRRPSRAPRGGRTLPGYRHQVDVLRDLVD